jgi:Uma2 family endonuclease
MSARVRIPATYDDLLHVPHDLVAELIDGELHTSPRPRPAHSRSVTRLSSRLTRSFEFGEDGPGGWIFLIEPEIHLGGDVLVPDLAGWRVERMRSTPQAAYIDLVPDWICEVLSPSNAGRDRTIKMPAYARHGVAYAWIVDVSERTLEVFHLENGRWSILSTHAGEESVSAEPFEALVLHPDDIYGPAPPSAPAP